MDPVSLAIISGILGGAAGGVAGEATGEVIKAYTKLRAMLMEKYGEKSILLRSIGALEQKPESKPKQEGIAEDVLDCGADKDAEVVQAAEALLALIKTQTGSWTHVEQHVSGDGNIFSGTGNVTVSK